MKLLPAGFRIIAPDRAEAGPERGHGMKEPVGHHGASQLSPEF